MLRFIIGQIRIEGIDHISCSIYSSIKSRCKEYHRFAQGHSNLAFSACPKGTSINELVIVQFLAPRSRDSNWLYPLVGDVLIFGINYDYHFKSDSED